MLPGVLLATCLGVPEKCSEEWQGNPLSTSRALLVRWPKALLRALSGAPFAQGPSALLQMAWAAGSMNCDPLKYFKAIASIT